MANRSDHSLNCPVPFILKQLPRDEWRVRRHQRQWGVEPGGQRRQSRGGRARGRVRHERTGGRLLGGRHGRGLRCVVWVVRAWVAPVAPCSVRASPLASASAPVLTSWPRRHEQAPARTRTGPRRGSWATTTSTRGRPHPSTPATARRLEPGDSEGNAGSGDSQAGEPAAMYVNNANDQSTTA